MKKPDIKIPFKTSSLGRVEFDLDLSAADKKRFISIEFKLDSGSDFTTLSVDDLFSLGYTEDYLHSCPIHVSSKEGVTTADGKQINLQYISNLSIKFYDRELQGCRAYFCLGTKMRSLFGSDLLKYFDREVNYSNGTLILKELNEKPPLSQGETLIQIYELSELKN